MSGYISKLDIDTKINDLIGSHFWCNSISEIASRLNEKIGNAKSYDYYYKLELKSRGKSKEITHKIGIYYFNNYIVFSIIKENMWQVDTPYCKIKNATGTFTEKQLLSRGYQAFNGGVKNE